MSTTSPRIKAVDLAIVARKIQNELEWRGAFKQGELNKEFIANDLIAEYYARPRIGLRPAQPKFGYEWQIYVTGGAYGTGHSPLPLGLLNSNGSLGWTKREALETLNRVLNQLEELGK